MYNIVSALEQRDPLGGTEYVGTLPGHAVGPFRRRGGGGGVLPLGFAGATGGVVRNMNLRGRDVCGR